ncbi:rod shape-determining protein MreD [Companilactobacillus sp. RD055328]|uniref:rod shape-determining protein MreD n=1 Tax=Companilactobacillus sp. RD055328 TaxID=2916634 RepID=UPI001FC7E433|nr:rod shape-determining protein MreD [Companilactobacillus sp. RD055328]
MTKRRFFIFLKQSSPFWVLMFAFYMDGILKYHLDFLNNNNNNGLPQILLLLFITMAFRFKKQQELIIYALIFGFFYDIYYMGIFGVYLVLFPLIVYLVHFIKNVIPDTFLFEFTTYIIALLTIRFIIFTFGSVFRSVIFNFIDFITFVMWPTLFFNIIAFVILYIPLTFLVDKIIEMRKQLF